VDYKYASNLPGVSLQRVNADNTAGHDPASYALRCPTSSLRARPHD
jgi:hypothetical protein